MPSSNITGLTALAVMQPDMLMYAALSPFGATDDRKITASDLLTTITPLDNNTAGLVVTNSAVPTVPQVVFTNAAGTSRMQIAMAGAATITDTFDEVSIFSSVAAKTLSLGLWNAIDSGEAAEIYLYAGAAGTDHMRLRAVDSGATSANLFDVPKSGVLLTSNTDTGGLILVAEAAAPIIFATGGHAFTDEKGRFDANGLTLGKASSVTGRLTLAVSGDADTQSFQAADTPAATNVFKWPGPDPVGGQVLTAAAPAAGIVVLSWTSPAAGSFAIGGTVTGGTAGSVLFIGAGPVLAQDNANFFWDDGNNRLGLGTATPGKLLHVNGIAQFGTVSATTGQIQLANSASANLTTIQAGNAAAARTYTWPTDFGAAGSVLTDAAGNGTLSWAASGGGAFSGARVTRSTIQTISNNTNTAVSFDTEAYDTDNYHSGGSPTRLTVSSDGKYLLTGSVTWDGNSLSQRLLFFKKNGATIFTSTWIAPNGVNPTSLTISSVIDAVNTDFFELFVFQNIGGNLDLTVSTFLPEFTISKL